jgi:ribosomal protein S18 acetylase RimI-like enzyme
MWVDPGHRGTGVAPRLVDAVVGWATDDGARVVSLWVSDGNARARRLYERLGFAGTGERRPLPSDARLEVERLERVLRS